jgi:hypothetical protein
MKRLTYLLLLVFLISSASQAQTHTLKWLRVNNMHHKVMNTGYQGESAGGRWGQHVYYYFDNFTQPNWVSRAYHVGVKNWTDEEGNTHPVKTAGSAIWGSSPIENTMPVPLDEEGNTIKRYYRYRPPEVQVGDFPLSRPFPLSGDEVAPEKIPGTADVMVESKIRLPIGVEIHQKALAWTTPNHDDYVIFDWTFTNTGNVDLDDEVELPDQVLEDVYFMRGQDTRPGGEYVPWHSYYGARLQDTLRIAYSYNEWQPESAIDNFGRPDRAIGYIQAPHYVGEASIHVDESLNSTADDPSQPFMSAHSSMERNWFKTPFEDASEEQWKTLYEAMSEGFGKVEGAPQMQDTYPNGRHMPPMNEWAAASGLATPQEVDYQWHPATFWSYGPYEEMQPGDSFRIVWATTIGSIDPQTAWDVGRAWLDGSAEWDGENNLPPEHQLIYPKINPTENDRAKDHWVATGKDSLFTNAAAAQWAAQNDYEVPTAPWPPDVTVQPLPDLIRVTWDGTASEQAGDFAGYRIYRARGNPGPTVRNERFIGQWELIADIEGTGTYSYDDTEAQRGQAYYYYVSAYDDGSNMPGVNGDPEVLESGRHMNKTTQAAHLTRPPKTVDDVRVVPNPFSREAEELQFSGEPDKIMFMNLPPECTIRIYTESGDLVKTLEHTDGSGDEPWGDIPDEHSVTETGQVIVSGMYIAHIETPSGESNIVKFAVVR